MNARRVFRLGLRTDEISSAVDDELAHHVEMRRRALEAQGWSTAAAAAEALRRFGNGGAVRRDCIALDTARERTTDRHRYVAELGQDLLHTFRALRRNPVFATVIVCTLAIGIGANTAVFTLVDGLLLQPLPVRAPAELVTIGDATSTTSSGHGTPNGTLFSYPLYRDLRDNRALFRGVLAAGPAGRIDLADRSGTQSEHPAGRFISGNYFSVLGIGAARGRVFTDGDDVVAGGSPGVVLSDRYWRRHFAADPAAVGQTLVINDVPCTIIGVTPPGFEGESVAEPTDLWLPITMAPILFPHRYSLDDRSSLWLLLLARRAPGVTFAAVAHLAPALVRQALIDHGLAPARATATPVPVGPGANGFSAVRGMYESSLLTMLAAAGVVLIIICGNVAHLLLARSVVRAPEFAVRRSLGAGRGRLIRQLLAESALLALLSLAVGLGVAWGVSRLLLALAATNGSPIPITPHTDHRVLLFTLALTGATLALTALGPTLRATRGNLLIAGSSRGAVANQFGSRRRLGAGAGLIAAQFALSLTLLSTTALLAMHLAALQSAPTGLDRDHLIIATVDPGRGGHYTGTALSRTVAALRDRLAEIPGVLAVSYSEDGIFNGTDWHNAVRIPGWVARTETDSMAGTDWIGPGYAAALGAHMVAGRDFTAADVDVHAAPVIVVNRSFARFYFGTANPVGQMISVDDTQPRRIVGVIADVRDRALDEAPLRRAYLPYLPDSGESASAVRMIVRTNVDPRTLVQPVRTATIAQDPLRVVDLDEPLNWMMRQSVAQQRLLTQLATGFGALALLLAAMGVYGVMSYAVTRRRAEIGLRLALGATPGQMVRSVIADAARVAAVGAMIGVPLTIAAVRILTSTINGLVVQWLAPSAALVVLALSAAVAAAIPAARAASIAPVTALNDR